jgi:hypothetical protein
MFYVRVEFMFCTLAGLFLLSISAIVLVLPPTDGTWLSIVWLTNFGYAVHLAPLGHKDIRHHIINRLANGTGSLQESRCNESRVSQAKQTVVVW